MILSNGHQARRHGAHSANISPGAPRIPITSSFVERRTADGINTPDWHLSPEDREERALAARLEVHAYTALIALALAWFVIPALALWLQGPLP